MQLDSGFHVSVAAQRKCAKTTLVWVSVWVKPANYRSTWDFGTHTYTISPLIFRHPPTACTGPAQRQDRSSSLRCGRSVLTRPLPSAVYPEAESQQNHWSTTLLTKPRPFRDDSATC